MSLHTHIQASRDGFRLDARLSAEPGRTVAVVGPNGAGKSTLLRCLAGLHPLDGGVLRLGGRTLEEPGSRTYVPSERRPVGVVFQDLLLFPNMSVLDNVAFGMRCRRVPRPRCYERAAELLRRLGLEGLEHRAPSSLSGGQAQRVALARALACRPELLLLDEPLSALDAGTRAEVRRDLKQGLADFGGVRLIVTHDPAEALALADHLVVLEEGRVVQTGGRHEVTAHPRSAYVAAFVGTNLFRGRGEGDHVVLADGGRLRVPGTVTGEVFASVHPQAVSLHGREPDGSPRNVWRGRVRSMDERGNVVRVEMSGARPVIAEITGKAAADLGVLPGVEMWASVKATEIRTYPA